MPPDAGAETNPVASAAAGSQFPYFDLLGIAPAFDLDMAALEKSYLSRQRLYHPDRFVGKPAPERQMAMQRSVDINNAYHTLKNPLSRARYLLLGQGIRVGGEGDSVRPSHALLTEVMEWREQAEEADNERRGELLAMLGDLTSDSLKAISSACQQAAWEAMAQETLRLSYLLKTREELEQRQRLSKP